MRFWLMILSLFLSLSAAVAQTAIPQAWRKTMTDDPRQNFVLEAFSRLLDDRTQRAIRTLTLTSLLGRRCRGSHVDATVFSHYLTASGLEDTSADDIDRATAVVEAEFSYFDYEKLAHLCAGIGYLFGVRGVAAPNMVSRGAGVPSFPYDPKVLYFTVRPFFPRGSE